MEDCSKTSEENFFWDSSAKPLGLTLPVRLTAGSLGFSATLDIAHFSLLPSFPPGEGNSSFHQLSSAKPKRCAHDPANSQPHDRAVTLGEIGLLTLAECVRLIFDLRGQTGHLGGEGGGSRLTVFETVPLFCKPQLILSGLPRQSGERGRAEKCLMRFGMRPSRRRHYLRFLEARTPLQRTYFLERRRGDGRVAVTAWRQVYTVKDVRESLRLRWTRGLQVGASVIDDVVTPWCNSALDSFTPQRFAHTSENKHMTRWVGQKLQSK